MDIPCMFCGEPIPTEAWIIELIGVTPPAHVACLEEAQEAFRQMREMSEREKEQ